MLKDIERMVLTVGWLSGLKTTYQSTCYDGYSVIVS